LSGLWLPNSPELDHIIPLAKGGDHTKSNVQCVCASCNRKKGARLQFLKVRTKWHEAGTDPVQVVQ
jgi:5-methylcytosine-specific restriction endonuclease McrA